MQDAGGEHTDSQRSAAQAVRAEARVAAAIETCTRELETKLRAVISKLRRPGAGT
jgi:hypothetical protein